jgi:uncharacterized protein with HEPN domain
MASAVAAIESYAARGRDAFELDPALRDAILYQIIVLGEAAKEALKADPELPTRHPEVDWSPIIRMRDRVTHHYWTTDHEIVWGTATVDVPELKRLLAIVLAA